jgi:hypothetical protein
LIQDKYEIFLITDGKFKGKETSRSKDSSELGGAIASEVTDITTFISHVKLGEVFREWEQRLQKCIDIEGDYVD